MQRSKAVLVAMFLLLASAAVLADPIRYEYNQTSATVPGLVITSSITINGGFTDLPTIASVGCGPVFGGPPCPASLDFGNLLAFDITVPGGTYTLADFVDPGMLPGPHPIEPWPYPSWLITPSGIRFINSIDDQDFSINFAPGTISFNTDNAAYAPCSTSGVCVTTGAFVPVPVPEPATMALLAIGAIPALRRLRRKN